MFFAATSGTGAHAGEMAGETALGMGQTDGNATFRLHGIDLRAALDSLMHWYPVSIVFLDSDVEGKSVSVSCVDCSFQKALDRVLSGTSLMWVRTGNQVILKMRPPTPLRVMGTVCGTVIDSLTGDLIAGAIVSVEPEGGGSPPRVCATNEYGFFSVPKIPPGKYAVRVRSVGYHATATPVTVATTRAVRQDVTLMQNEIALQEMVVEGQRSALTSAQGFSHGVYYRSAPSDQNQYLLDGARIYNPSHFGGVLSTFDIDVLSDVQVVPGGLPPYYGGRIGGILDLSMREGTRERFSGSVGIGSMGSRLSVEGPIADGTTFLVSGRRYFPDVQVPFLTRHGSPARQGMTELISKLSHRLSGSSRLFLSGYLARDSYNNHVEAGAIGLPSRLNNTFDWGNSALNFRWIGIASPSLFLNASAVYTRYGFSLEHNLTGDRYPPLFQVDTASPGQGTLPASATYSSDFLIEDLSIRAHAEHYYDEEHTVRGGFELTRHYIHASISEFSSLTAPVSLPGSTSWELSVYLQDQWMLSPAVSVEFGARATNFSADKTSFSGIDPRFSILARTGNDLNIYGSVTAVNQFMHVYRNSGIFLLYPTTFWYPSSDVAKPSSAMHVTAGLEKGAGTYAFSVESFYRVTQGIHEFAQDTSTLRVHNIDAATLTGKGTSYGGDISLRKRSGDLTGSIGYALSWARNTFNELNGGQPFEPRLNRRNEIRVEAQYVPSDEWLIGMLLVATWDEALKDAPANAGTASSPFSGIDPITAQASDAIVSNVDVNGSRLPGFQRLELNFVRRFVAWAMPCQVQLRLLNGYGLLDPIEWHLRPARPLYGKWTAGLQPVRLFPLFPTFTFSMRF